MIQSNVTSRFALTAPAKINLFLRILGKRSDGFHDIDSLILPLELADEIEINISPSDTLNIVCRCPSVKEIAGSKNLAFQAAEVYCKTVGLKARILLTVKKNIWIASGMGGGSTDAAQVLSTLNRVFGRLSPPNLHSLAADLGADVPFFLDPRPMRARGKGDLLTPVAGVPQLDLVLMNPGVEVTTREVFSRLAQDVHQTDPKNRAPKNDFSKIHSPDSIPPGNLGAVTVAPEDRSSDALHLESPDPDNGWPNLWPNSWNLINIPSFIRNDLKKVTSRLVPQIMKMESYLLKHGALATGMTGSGPTVFGIFLNKFEALRAASQIQHQLGQGPANANTAGHQEHGFASLTTRTLVP